MSCNTGRPSGSVRQTAGSGTRNSVQFRNSTRCLRVLPVPALLLCLLLCLPPAAGQDSQPLEHVVIVWLKQPGNQDAQSRIIAASQALTAIPGVVSLRVGTAVASERPIVDSSFDVALVVSFSDRAALDSYLNHPLHVQLVETTLKPLVERILVYDFSPGPVTGERQEVRSEK